MRRCAQHLSLIVTVLLQLQSFTGGAAMALFRTRFDVDSTFATGCEEPRFSPTCLAQRTLMHSRRRKSYKVGKLSESFLRAGLEHIRITLPQKQSQKSQTTGSSLLLITNAFLNTLVINEGSAREISPIRTIPTPATLRTIWFYDPSLTNLRTTLKLDPFTMISVIWKTGS